MPHSDHSRQHVVNTANYNRGTRLYDPIPSSLYIYIRSFSNRLFCTYVIHDQLMFQSICVCGSRRGGELQRSVCRNAALSSPEAEYCYIIRDLASRPMLSSPHSPAPVLGSAQVYGTFRLSWSRCSPGSWLLDAALDLSKDSSISQPRTWRGNSLAAHNPYCSVN